MVIDKWIAAARELGREIRRENPFGGWGHEITVNTPDANVVKQRLAAAATT
jgi:hypothetical protein